MVSVSGIVVGCTCFLQVVCATSIMVVTALKLHHVAFNWDSKSWNADVHNVCLLGHMDNGGNLCYLAYMAGGISVLATGLLSLLQCCTCHLCGLGVLLDGAFAAGGTLMWLVVGAVFKQHGEAPAMARAPRPEWRESITILSFVACGLFGVMALAAAACLLSALCCGGRGCGGARGRRSGSGSGTGGGGVACEKQQQHSQGGGYAPHMHGHGHFRRHADLEYGGAGKHQSQFIAG